MSCSPRDNGKSPSRSTPLPLSTTPQMLSTMPTGLCLIKSLEIWNKPLKMPRRPSRFSLFLLSFNCLQVDPKYSKSYGRLGDCYIAKKDYPAAIHAFKEGLAVDPSAPNLLTGLETAKRLQGMCCRFLF